MKIELISPFMRDPGNVGNAFRLPQMSLGLLAGLAPQETDISITDELVEPIVFDPQTDLVGITVNTQTALRAYEIADAYRSIGVAVVMGGIHPTVAPQEASEHADALVIGEAEGLWAELLRDFAQGRLKETYSSSRFPCLSDTPIPTRRLFKKDRYETLNLVQISRGCPHACHFCSVSTLYGEGVRLRPLEAVMQEIETLEGEDVFFVDDNIAAKTGYALDMLRRLAPLKKRWIGQASISVASSGKTVELLRKSGCQGLFIGFETTSKGALREVGKIQNIRLNYMDCIKRLHDNGISILGSFIVGFDLDDRSCFENLVDFVHRSQIDVVDISTLTPYPKTPLYRKLHAEGRLLDERWWLKYHPNDVVYRPKLMSRQDLHEGRTWALRELYRFHPTARRCLNGLFRRSLFGNRITWKTNMGYRNNALGMLDAEKNPSVDDAAAFHRVKQSWFPPPGGKRSAPPGH